MHTNDHHDDGIADVVDRLRSERPHLTAIELDNLKRSVLRARRPVRHALASRVALIATLVLGMTFSTAGAGLAITGFAEGGGQAAKVQYDDDDTGGKVLGEQGGGDDNGGSNGAGTDDEAVQPARQLQAEQVVASGGSLPFTGFAALPVLLLGVGLLSTGLILRRRSRAS